MRTIDEILDGPSDERTLQAAFAREPMTEENARHWLRQAHGITPRKALMRTLRLAIATGNLHAKAVALYAEYIAAVEA